jgi:cyclophilin family peptidyl-prolyl cis-trans isomerase
MKSPLRHPCPDSVFLLLIALLALSFPLSAAQPTLLKPFPPLLFPANAQPYSTNLNDYFNALPATNMVRVTSTLTNSNGVPLGFTMQLFPSNAPMTVANFLAYVNDGAYQNTLIHRSVPGFIIQTGGYDYSGSPLATFPNTVPSEASNGLSNTQGTVSMALVGSDANSATDQWFVNLGDNSQMDSAYTYTNLQGALTTNPPFTVFARVIGNGMSTVAAIASLPIYRNLNAPFNELPVQSTNLANILSLNNLVHLSVATLPYFSLSSDPAYYATQISNTSLTISYTGGTNSPPAPVTITVYASDTNGLGTNSSFEVWDHTNAIPKVSYITQIPYSGNPVFSIYSSNYGLYVPSLPDGTPTTYRGIGWTPGLIDTNKNFAVKGTGTLSIEFTSPSTFFYQATTNIFKIKIGYPQSISFPALTTNSSDTVSFHTNAIALKATANSKLPVSYALVGGSPARISGSDLYLTGVGTVGVIASQSGNSNYLAATPVTNSLIVAKAPQSIVFPEIPNQNIPVKAPVPLKATSTSKLAVTYRIVSGSGVITNSNAVFVTGHGTIAVAADQSGDGRYLAASSVTNSFDAKLTQTLTPLPKLPNTTYSYPWASFTIKVPTTSAQTSTNVSISATGPVTVTSVDSGTDRITITGAGKVTLTATQAGDGYYFPASVTTSFNVAKASQKISAFTSVSPKANGVIPFPVPIPQINSTNQVTVTASGAGYISATNGSNVMISLNNSGKVILTASQSGNSNYLPAKSVTQSFTVSKGDQGIVFPSIQNQDLGHVVTLGAYSTNSSGAPTGLPITYSITAGRTYGYLADGNHIQTTGLGQITVVASQAGTTGYNSATSRTNTFSVMATP